MKETIKLIENSSVSIGGSEPMKEAFKSIFVKLFGWPAPLLHADTAVLDRWLWLRQRLPRGDGSPCVLDIGCGTGAFTIGAALRGYQALGLSNDERNQMVAAKRARMCRAATAKFAIQDIRELDKREDLHGKFDVAIMTEVIEHILDDRKLMTDAARCLKPNGRLLLTTPNFNLRPIDPTHEGPFPTVEDGGHVRKGYTAEELFKLSEIAGLVQPEISYCTGFVSQKVTHGYLLMKRIQPVIAWSLLHPFRILPLLMDSFVTQLMHYPEYSICLEARKPS